MGEIADVLERAADLISPEGAWVKGEYALDAEGGSPINADDAVCFCVLGAISVAYGEGPTDEAGWDAQDFLRRLIRESIPDWNDAPERTKDEVVATLRKAAALAREQGK